MKLYKKIGGTEILRQYRKAGVLGYALFLTLNLGFSKRSLEILRLAVQNKIQGKLKRNYSYVVRDFIKNYEGLPKNRSNKVWVCWLQGIEDAPLVVRRCYASLHEHLTDREIILITEDNYKDYVDFPQHIVDKYKRGIITHTHFSDLLRLELLIRHGGTWIDATVLCTGGDIPKYILNSDLFVFQILKPGRDGHSLNMSSWLMTSCTNNKILLLTRELIYEYWKKNNSMVDYYLLHTFFNIACETYQEEWNDIVKFCNSIPHILLLSLFEDFDEERYTIIKNMTCFHKLSYKHPNEMLQKKNTYYDIVIKKGYYSS
ncbi:capsular polysaccharide synthesis protein [Rossellomorea vietnamensis]|uniref:capsular polysaccharide synthesis protein n=1 Tax=Rossellomorea vietnamensis TaxID=218284 RepID=UPI003D2E2CFD